MSYPVQIWFLGLPRAEAADQPIQRFESRKALVLLAYLASRGEAIARHQLAELFWPDQSSERGRANLRHLLHTLAAQLPGCLVVDRQSVQLLREPVCWMDIIAFEAVAVSDTLTGLGAAADLYRGSFLEGITLDDCPELEIWLTQERERWHERAAHVLASLSARARERQEWIAGLRAVDRLLTLDPWREAAHQEKMRLLAFSGQRDSAMAQYESCRRILADELGLDPSPETMALYEQIRDGELAPAPSPVFSHMQVPIPATALLGRSAELAQLTQLLAQPECRLLTIIGPGGIGKTRLALELAVHQQGRYSDGVWVVELASIHDPDLVAPTIAHAFGLHESDSRTTIERLTSWIGKRSLLLFLDNFEQLLAAATLVRELLAHCPRLTVLVTSRIPLHLRGEQEFLLSPLALPTAQAFSAAPHDGPELMAAYAATALFLERARGVDPRFVLTEANAPLIAAICRRLDGLPLAIELAAARTKLFPPAALLARLERRLPMLKGSTQDRYPHQQTIRDTIAWSYQMLAPREQQLLAQLSIFVGAWNLEAAEAVVQFDPAEGEPLEVIDGIGQLVDQSLVQRHSDEHGEPRFAMLETIREYGQELLTQDVKAQLRQRHAVVYLAEAEVIDWDKGSSAQKIAMTERLEQEHDNLRAALAYAIETGDERLALRFGHTLWRFWHNRGYLEEASHWLIQIRAIARPSTSDAYLSLLQGLATIYNQQRKRELNAVGIVQELFSLAQERNDRYWLGMACLHSAYLQPMRQEVLAMYEAAFAHFQELGNQRLMASALLNMGRTIIFDPQGSERAKTYFEEALRLSVASDNFNDELYAHLHLGLLVLQAGQLPQALDHFQSALRFAATAKFLAMLAYSFDAIGGVAAISRQGQVAVQLLAAAEAMHTRIGALRSPNEQAIYEQWLAVARTQFDPAEYERRWAEGQMMPLESLVGIGLTLALPSAVA